MGKNKYILAITFISLLLACSETNDKSNRKLSTVNKESPTADKEAENSSEKDSIEDPFIEESSSEDAFSKTVFSEETSTINNDLGLMVNAPSKAIYGKSSINLKIDTIRQAFDSNSNFAVMLGNGANIKVEDGQTKEAVAENLFSKNINATYKIALSDLDNNLDNLIIAIRNIYTGETKYLPTSAIVSQKIDDQFAMISFPVAGGEFDIQVGRLVDGILSAAIALIPRPYDPVKVTCSSLTTTSLKLNWGTPGLISAYKVVYSQTASDIENDLGCNFSSSVDNIPGTANSAVVENLISNKTYYMRLCSKNNSFPTPDISPGIKCSATTQPPTVPTLQLVWGVSQLNGLPPIYKYSTKSDGNWSTPESIVGSTNLNVFTPPVLDSNFNMHFLYQTKERESLGSFNYKIKFYHQYFNGAWNSQIVHEATYGEFSGIKLNSFNLKTNHSLTSYYSGDSSGMTDNFKHYFLPQAGDVLLAFSGSLSTPANFPKTLVVDSNGVQKFFVNNGTGFKGTVVSFSNSTDITTLELSKLGCSDSTYGAMNIAAAKIDNNNKYHLMYSCNVSNSVYNVYYATDKSGTWVYTPIVTNVGISKYAYDLSINKSGDHIAATFQTILSNNASSNLYEKTSDSSTFVLKATSGKTSDENIYYLSDNVGALSSHGYEFLAMALDFDLKTHIITRYATYVKDNATVGQLLYLTNSSGDWTLSEITTGLIPVGGAVDHPVTLLINDMPGRTYVP